MAYIVKDRVRETSTFTGTGNVTLAGRPDATFVNFGDVMADGDTCDVAIFGAGDYEICPAAYVLATNELIRGAPTQSSNGAAAVNFQPGLKTIVLAMPAAKAAQLLSDAGGFRNKFRNAALDIWSRGTSGSVTAGTPAYTADGWVAGCTGANVAWSRQTGRVLSAYSLRLTGASGVTRLFVRQRIESFLSFALAAGPAVTVQARVYNNTGGSITPTITVRRAGSTDNWGSPATDVNAVSLQPCADTAWTLVSYTFSPNGGAGTGIEVTIDFGNNFGANTKYVQVCELDIRAGSFLQLPEMRPPGVEMVICQRYLPSWRTLLGAFAIGQCLSTSSAAVILPFYVPPRVVPTGVIASAGSDFSALDATANLRAFTSFTLNAATASGLQLIGAGASNLVGGNACQVYGNSSAYVIGTGGEL